MPARSLGARDCTGSKDGWRLLGDMRRGGARRALDLFGTTRVAQEFKRRGAHTIAVDNARYAYEFARCYIDIDADRADASALAGALADLTARPGTDGYVTDTFCRRSRFFQEHNGRRIDAMRDAIERDYRDSWMYPVLLTSLIEAADRVDSTTGVQMAYVKQWAARAGKTIELRVPDLIGGPGLAVFGDACALVRGLGSFDLAYVDPPYNQHRYFTNYHIWETMVAWDAPEHYGVACKRVDAREDHTKSVFNDRKRMPDALAQVIAGVDAPLVIVSQRRSVVSDRGAGSDVARCVRVRTPVPDSKVTSVCDRSTTVGEKVGQAVCATSSISWCAENPNSSNELQERRNADRGAPSV